MVVQHYAEFRGYHTSFPTGSPQSVSACRFSGVMRETNSSRDNVSGSQAFGVLRMTEFSSLASSRSFAIPQTSRQWRQREFRPRTTRSRSQAGRSTVFDAADVSLRNHGELSDA